MHSAITRWIGTESLLVKGLRWRIESRRIPCAYWIPSLAQRCIINWLGRVVMLRYQCTLNGVVQASTFLRHAYQLDEYTFQMVTKITLTFDDCYCVENAGVYPWKLSVYPCSLSCFVFTYPLSSHFQPHQFIFPQKVYTCCSTFQM